MIKTVKKGFSFTTPELLVLLALKKAKGIYGLFDKSEEYSQKEINEAFFHLCKSGVLSRAEDTFIPSEEVSKILDDIIAAKRLVTFSASNESVYEQCAYVGGNSVYLRFDGIDSERIHIYPIDIRELAESVVDSGWGIESALPSTSVGKIERIDLAEDYYEYIKLPKTELLDKEYVHSIIEVIDLKNNAPASKVTVISQGVDDVIICDNGKETKSYRYTKELAREIIIKAAEGKEYDFC